MYKLYAHKTSNHEVYRFYRNFPVLQDLYRIWLPCQENSSLHNFFYQFTSTLTTQSFRTVKINQMNLGKKHVNTVNYIHFIHYNKN